MMDLKREIFNELKAKNLKAKHAWEVKRYIPFCNSLVYVKLEEFYNTMKELSNEGYFEIRDDIGGPMYILTDKCEQYIIDNYL